MPPREPFVPPTHLLLRWTTQTGTVVACFDFLEFCEAATEAGPSWSVGQAAELILGSADRLLRKADAAEALRRGVDHS